MLESLHWVQVPLTSLQGANVSLRLQSFTLWAVGVSIHLYVYLYLQVNSHPSMFGDYPFHGSYMRKTTFPMEGEGFIPAFQPSLEAGAQAYPLGSTSHWQHTSG